MIKGSLIGNVLWFDKLIYVFIHLRWEIPGSFSLVKIQIFQRHASSISSECYTFRACEYERVKFCHQRVYA